MARKHRSNDEPNGGEDMYEQEARESREAQVSKLGASTQEEPAEPEPPKTPYDGWSDEMKSEAEAFGNKCIEIFTKLTPEMVGILSRTVSAVQSGIADPIYVLKSMGVPLEFPPTEEADA